MSVDVVIPIHNALGATRDCLASVAMHRCEQLNLLRVLDDGSDAHTASEIVHILEEDAFSKVPFEFTRHERAQGFVHTCNSALSASTADHVVLLNSDTLVTEGWLQRLVTCAESADDIAVVMPMSNRASFHSIALPPGFNVFEFAESLAAFDQRIYPDLVTASGFCMLMTRRGLTELGGFDTAFAPAYGEESDYCMRARAKGLRVIGADDAFVYHRGAASHRNRSALAKAHLKLFRKRWAAPYDEAMKEYQQQRELDAVRARYERFDLGARLFGYQWDATLVDCVRYGGTPYLALHAAGAALNRGGKLMQAGAKWLPLSAPGRGVGFTGEGLRRLGEGTKTIAADHLRRPGNPEYTFLLGARSVFRGAKGWVRERRVSPVHNNLAHGGRLRVIYVLPRFKLAGGTLSVVQLVNRLTMMGVDAKIATTREYPHEGYDSFPLYSQPYVYDTTDDLIQNFPEADIAVATFWTTAQPVAEIAAARGMESAYFIQGYEQDFYGVDDVEMRQQVLDTYHLLPNKIVKSQWLRQKLLDHGHDAKIIPLGMDLDIFYPRDVERTSHPRVLAMAKLDNAHKDIPHLKASFGRLKEMCPEVEIVFFGSDNLDAAEFAFPYTNVGVVRGAALAELYSSCDVFVDCSVVQGFGRPGLEAMACGCGTVLTHCGGIVEYAEHEVNCLMGDPTDAEAVASRVAELIEYPAKRLHLIEGGLNTAARFGTHHEAEMTATLFRSMRKPRP